ncbi:putative morphogenetic protein [Escherichia coli]|nr:putative morphogenetic protein [Escherichia coli]
MLKRKAHLRRRTRLHRREAVYRVGFGDIWRGIYGQENWLSNPWVWVIEFKRIQEATSERN